MSERDTDVYAYEEILRSTDLQIRSTKTGEQCGIVDRR